MTRITLRTPTGLALIVTAMALLLTVGLAQAPARAATTGTSVTTASTSTSKTLARQLMRTNYGWTSTTQWNCLNALWTRESGWRVTAGRPTGSYGIPQANPGRKMGTGWRTSARTQITWGLRYIKGRYVTPCRANAHQKRTGWY